MLSFLRIIKFSLQDLVRNVWLSLVVIIILLLSLISVNSLIAVRMVSDSTVEVVKESLDISLYLKSEAGDKEILALQEYLENLPEIKNVKFISKQEALDSFRARHIDSPEIIQALKEIGSNPLSPSFSIMPRDFNGASVLINKLREIDSEIIESRDFSDNAIIISKIQNITKRINEVGIMIIVIFILISLLVIYNSIRVAVYTHRKEIEVIRLVGASDFFVYAPHVFSAFIYALLSTFLAVIIIYPLLSLFQPYLEIFLSSYKVNLLSYFVYNFWSIFGTQFLSIFFIAFVGSLLAVRKYAKV